MILPCGGTPRVGTVSIRTDRVVNRFDPRLALGGCIDGAESGETDRVFTPRNVEAMRSAGLGALTYRLRTELAGEAWHWNPEGRFSEGDRGYWNSDARAGEPIRRSFGYRLPRRGDTVDQANDDGYSRLTDGRADTFWKSNPYLDDASPQWVVLDLRRETAVDTIRLRWSDPYALRYRVEFWDGESRKDFDVARPGRWRAFPKGDARGRGGDETLRLGAAGRPVRYVRLTLLASSHTPARTKDPRDARGFAIREIEIGRWQDGRLVDAVLHRPDHGQTACYVSSTDPWHRAEDRDPRVEQPGLDLVARSPLARGLPMLLPVPVLYGTPEDTAALGRWLQARGYPVRGFEMGEEPDGQICAPEEYAALYLRMADALRPALPQAVFGGPGFQTIENDFGLWVVPGRGSWLPRLVAALAARGRRRDLGFVSFEWYPFDAVDRDPAEQLAAHKAMFRAALARLRGPGLPLLMTEYGYSAFAGPAEVDLPGAILNLDAVGTFLAAGGRAAYLYGYPPAPLVQEKPGQWGNLALFLAGDGGRWAHRLPTYWAARMMTQDWCGGEPCDFLRARSPDPLVAVFAVRRTDGRLAALLLNKDSRRERTVRLSVEGRMVAGGGLVQYGPAQYVWKAAGRDGHPLRELPPVRGRFAGLVTLPPYSVTVATFQKRSLKGPEIAGKTRF